ncbi:hypothetical protein APHAL10511_000534, partial [Amanita phalloides]
MVFGGEWTNKENRTLPVSFGPKYREYTSFRQPRLKHNATHLLLTPLHTAPSTTSHSPSLQLQLSSLPAPAPTAVVISANDDGELVWNREEGLSTITASEFVELPEQPPSSLLDFKARDSLGACCATSSSPESPHYLFHFIVRFGNGSFFSQPHHPICSVKYHGGLVRDPFG